MLYARRDGAWRLLAPATRKVAEGATNVGHVFTADNTNMVVLSLASGICHSDKKVPEIIALRRPDGALLILEGHAQVYRCYAERVFERCRELSPAQCSAGIHSCTRLVMPLSAMILAPVTRLAAGLDTKTITRAISSTVPMRPHGICFRAQS